MRVLERVVEISVIAACAAGCGPAGPSAAGAAEDADGARSARCDALSCAPRAVGSALALGERFACGLFEEEAGQVVVDVAVDARGDAVVLGTFSGAVDFGGGVLESEGMTDVFVASFDAAGHHLWSKRFGGEGRDHGQAVAMDRRGNLFITGTTAGAIDFGGGALGTEGEGTGDIFLAKLDARGGHLWSQRFGGSDIQHPDDIAVDDMGNVIVVGWFEGPLNIGGDLGAYGHLFLAKFDAAGKPVYRRAIRGASDLQVSGLAVDRLGNAVVAGVLYGTADMGGLRLRSAGSTDAFVAKFDPAGRPLWSRRYGNRDYQEARAVAVDEMGNVFVAGWFEGIVDLGGGPLFPISDDRTGEFIAKLDASGEHVFSRRVEGLGFGARRALAVDGRGGVTLAGDFSGELSFGDVTFASDGRSDLLLAQLDGAGELVSATRIGGRHDLHLQSLAVDDRGRPLLVASFAEASEASRGHAGQCSSGLYFVTSDRER